MEPPWAGDRGASSVPCCRRYLAEESSVCVAARLLQRCVYVCGSDVELEQSRSLFRERGASGVG
jgi:hypothetical protein